jgi:hypothetical protein
MKFDIDFKKYRWFFTSSGKLVVGGKNEEQNELFVKSMLDTSEELIVMHTSDPGSPFSFIISEIKYVNAKDLEEAAIFTACFSKAWKLKKKNAEVGIFKTSQIFKKKGMKIGTFGVLGSETKKVKLRLYLTKQQGTLRAVPFKVKGPELFPGSLEKEKSADEISKILKVEKEEVMQAIPAGGFEIK